MITKNIYYLKKRIKSKLFLHNVNYLDGIIEKKDVATSLNIIFRQLYINLHQLCKNTALYLHLV